MTINELVTSYYDGISRKIGWESPLSDTIAFRSPGANTDGKSAYVSATNGFLKAVEKASVQRRIIDSNSACIWMTYDLVSPRGSKTALDVVEIWTASRDQLQSLTIYFDTAAFASFMQS